MVKEPTDFVIAMDINSINDHSPWWARAFAIFLGFMLLTVANFFYLEIFGINGINHYTFQMLHKTPEFILEMVLKTNKEITIIL